ncbi:MAG: type II toxin-antitoxin system mRNA interferase toxin, RelE/StbE family [Melioribacter sp.]|nr:type II toxin-antitoxin system mRNA interferase toxin, RelE/StbE family [Melioribacter sp.]
MEFIWDSGFKRSFRKKIYFNKVLLTKFKEKINLFTHNPFDPQLKTHKLSGTLKDCWAFTLDYETRVIFKFLGTDKVLLIDVGTHEEVY